MPFGSNFFELPMFDVIVKLSSSGRSRKLSLFHHYISNILSMQQDESRILMNYGLNTGYKGRGYC